MHDSPDMRPGAGPCATASPPAPTRSIRAAPALGGDAQAVRRANIAASSPGLGEERKGHAVPDDMGVGPTAKSVALQRVGGFLYRRAGEWK
ncbi:hypothetical protein ACSVIA_28475 [Rhodococcus erythropolis]|uniref:hypothetical protein n=1 Tax=Rhodococcus erythropolis TaxID=1833 RepID=UPI0040426B9C